MKKCVWKEEEEKWRGRPMYCINREADWHDDMSFNRINHKPMLWDKISSALKRKGWIDSGSSNVKTKTSDCVTDTDSQAIIVSLLLSARIARAHRPSPTVLLHPIHPQTKKHIQKWIPFSRWIQLVEDNIKEESDVWALIKLWVPTMISHWRGLDFDPSTIFWWPNTCSTGYTAAEISKDQLFTLCYWALCRMRGLIGLFLCFVL